MTAADPYRAVHRTILAVWRIEQPRLITSLARMLRDVPLAEELTQEALLAALEHWPASGIPEKPGAWLMATAKRRALDHLRRARMLARKFDARGRLYVACYEPSQILRVETDGTVEVLHHDPTAHLLCHPTNVAFRGETLIAANLGRWHLTAIDAGVAGVPLPPRAEASR